MRPRRFATLRGLGLVSLLVAATHAPGPARAEVVERVAAVVNDHPILLSDLRRKAAPFLEQALADAPTPDERKGRLQQIYKRLLDQLVDDELVEQAASKMHVSVNESEVDQAIENVRRQNQLDEAAFWEAVRAQGYAERQYRADVRKQLLRLKVLNQRVRSRVHMSEQTVREAYDDKLREARRAQKFRAAHVFIPLSDGASATEVAAAMEQARQLRATLTPDNFDQRAAESQGGDLGWLEQGDLPDMLEEVLLGLNEGEISQPVRGPSGIHLFMVHERQSGMNALPPFEAMQAQIQNELLDKAMLRQEELFLRGLRRDAVIETRE